METELFKSCYNLPELSVTELRGNGRSDNGKYLVFRVIFALFDYVYRVYDKRFIGNRAERTLIYASSARNAFVVIYASFFFRTHGYRSHFAGKLAGAFVVPYRVIRAYLGTCAALLTFRFVDMRDVVFVESNRAEAASVVTTVRKTTSACVCNLVTVDGAFVAGDVDNFNNILVVRVAAHSEFNSLG